MLDQCLALLEIKFLLMRRTWTPSKWVSMAVMIALLMATVAVALALSIAMFILGLRWLAGETPFVALIAFDVFLAVFLLLWFWGLLTELQRSDVIDLRVMLFLPISLPMVFTLNFLSSLFNAMFIVFVPALFALMAGLAVRRGAGILLGIPLGLAFFLMLAAWAYYARGLLAVLMENKRRRRLVMTILPLFFVFLGQLPNIVVHGAKFLGARHPEMSQAQVELAVTYANLALPVGWLPYGMAGLVEGRMEPALLGFLGMSGFALLGLLLGFRSTLRYYTGAVHTRFRAKVSKRARKPLTARRLPFLGEDTAAMTLAEFLNYARHPQIRILMIMPLCMGLLILFMYYSGGVGEQWRPQGPWPALLLVVWPFFNFSLMLFNVFGIDRQGFRGLVLFPTSRYKYFLSKNLALFPFVGGLSLLMVVIGAFFIHTPLRHFLISLTQILQLYLLYCLTGNLLSVYFPYRITRDPLRVRANRSVMFLLGLASMALVGIMLVPSSLCLFLDDLAARWWNYHGWSIGLMTGVVMLSGIAVGYGFSLTHLGDLLLAREQKVLDVLLRDRE